MSLLPPLPPTFEAALRDVNAKGGQFRLAAAVALGDAPQGREDEARAGLLVLARDADPRIRAAALRSAARLPHRCLVPLVDEALDRVHPLTLDAALELAAALDIEGRSRILAALRSAHRDVRFAAARAIALSPFEGAGRALLDAFPDDDAETSAQIARALGDLRVHEAADALARAASSAHRVLRSAASFALADLGDLRGVPGLVAALDDRETLGDAALLLAKLERREACAAVEAQANRLFLPPLERAIVLGALVRLAGHADAERKLARMLRSLLPTRRAVAAHVVVELELRTMLPAVRDAKERGRLPREIAEHIEDRIGGGSQV